MALFFDFKYCMRFKIITLIDITKTDARRNADDKLYSQQSNYNTVVQTASLKANVIPEKIEYKNGSINSIGFGSKYKNKQKYWELTFDNEYYNSLTLDDLLEDFNFVPIVVNLNETVEVENPTFLTKDEKNKNIVFVLID